MISILKSLLRPKQHRQGPYISCKETVQAASLANLSVCDYLEKNWDQVGGTQLVIDNMEKLGCFVSNGPMEILEIGPGTGRYAEKIMAKYSVNKYFSYEIAEDWSYWLEQTYGPKLIRRNADGKSLNYEADNSMDLVHAHGVITSINIVNIFKYFQEMTRVCKRGGFIAFDFFPVGSINLDNIKKWIDAELFYPVLTPEDMIRGFFENAGYEFRGSFDNKYGQGFSKYHVYRNANTV